MNSTGRQEGMTGIYVHFPYCIQKCSYCDFFSIGLDNENNRTIVEQKALKEFELSITSEFIARLGRYEAYSGANTIYFGGGTSSLMPPETIYRLLSLFKKHIGLTPDCEITLEGNPENFTPDYLLSLHQLGVTRVNVGIQTFSGDFLRKMNRYFNPDRYEAILDDLETSPIENVGVDLIYGFPGQTEENFQADLEKISASNLNHLSIYSLTAETGTPYANGIERRRATPPDEELQYRIFSWLPNELQGRGYNQYEISNFAKPDALCRHNLRYWLYESYIGLGPGAHGFDGRFRYANSRNIAAWRKEPTGAKYEEHNPIFDLPLNVLRLLIPIDIRTFNDVFKFHPQGTRLADAVVSLLQQWVERGYGQWVNSDTSKSKSNPLSPTDSKAEFVWNFDGYSRLNERTLEMIELLEKQG